MKLVFWNTKRKVLVEPIIDILTTEQPDLLFLAEPDDSLIIANQIPIEASGYEHFENPGCDRILILKKKDTPFSLSTQAQFFSAVRSNGLNLNIVAVHLPSQMFSHLDGLKANMRDFRNEIDAEFGESRDTNILIIGDFNVSPFDKPMIDFDGFSASNTKNLHIEAKSLKKSKQLYYNPTWKLFGDSRFPGTFYYARPSASSFDILQNHFLDQILISYSMTSKIISEEIRVIHDTATHTFLSKSNKIKLSDHLPLMYKFEI